MIRQLQLVLIDVPLRDVDRPVGVTLPQSLLYCLQKGKVRSLWNSSNAIPSLRSWQQSLLHALPPSLRGAGLAAAALQWRGEGGALRSGTWMQVQLVNALAGLNDVHISVLEPAPDDELALMQALQPLLLLSGFELHQSTVGHWYVWCENILDIQTPPIKSSLTTNSYNVMPSGSDAQMLRRLMTEIQMLLHQHPVNQSRERIGRAPFNTLWFSGAGSPVTAASGTLQRIMGNMTYVQGLCDQLNATCWPVPCNVNELLNLRDDDMVLVLSAANLDLLNRNWLSPLLAQVAAGAIEHLHIYVDHLRVSLTGGRWPQFRRWLSRSNSVTHILVENELS